MPTPAVFPPRLRRVNESGRPRCCRQSPNKTNTDAQTLQICRVRREAAGAEAPASRRNSCGEPCGDSQRSRAPSRPSQPSSGVPGPVHAAGRRRKLQQEVYPRRTRVCRAEPDELSGISFESWALGGAQFPNSPASFLPPLNLQRERAVRRNKKR